MLHKQDTQLDNKKQTVISLLIHDNEIKTNMFKTETVYNFHEVITKTMKQFGFVASYFHTNEMVFIQTPNSKGLNTKSTRLLSKVTSYVTQQLARSLSLEDNMVIEGKIAQLDNDDDLINFVSMLQQECAKKSIAYHLKQHANIVDPELSTGAMYQALTDNGYDYNGNVPPEVRYGNLLVSKRNGDNRYYRHYVIHPLQKLQPIFSKRLLKDNKFDPIVELDGKKYFACAGDLYEIKKTYEIIDFFKDKTVKGCVLDDGKIKVLTTDGDFHLNQ